MSLSAIQNLDHTVIFCADIRVMRDFYHEIMGFAVENDRPNWVTLRIGGTRLSLAAALPGQLHPAKELPNVQLTFRVPPSALDGCREELSRRSIRIERGPVDLPDWHHRALFFSDPEGNRLEIYAEI